MARRELEAMLPPEERVPAPTGGRALKIMALLAGAGVLIWVLSESRPEPLSVPDPQPDPPVDPAAKPALASPFVSSHHTSPPVPITIANEEDAEAELVDR